MLLTLSSGIDSLIGKVVLTLPGLFRVDRAFGVGTVPVLGTTVVVVLTVGGGCGAGFVTDLTSIRTLS